MRKFQMKTYLNAQFLIENLCILNENFLRPYKFHQL